MAIDYIVHFECAPKLELGHGDDVEGTARLLDMLKARSRADAITELARKQGQNPSEISITIQITGPGGDPKPQQVTLAELRAMSAELENYSAACTECPANILRQPFGCFGIINYPIQTQSEEWVMNRVQPANTLGGQFLLGALADFGYTGAYIDEMRRHGMFEAKLPINKIVEKKLFRSIEVNSNQVLEAILGVGEALSSDHCFGILLWLGAIAVDGKVPSDIKDQRIIETLTKLRTPQDRAKRTRLAIDSPSRNPAFAQMQNLVKGLYGAWVNNVPLLVSA